MEDYFKYSKEELLEMFNEIDQPLKSANQIAVRLCEILSCDNCPVVIYQCDNRTIYEKACLHASCQSELHNWIIKEFNGKDIPKPVIRFDNYNHEWWAGRCPSCNKIINYDYSVGRGEEGNRKCYCSKCGQLCDFEDV